MKKTEIAWITQINIVAVECLLSLFYHSKCFFCLLLTEIAMPLSILGTFWSSWVRLILWLDMWIFCARAPSGVQYEWNRHHGFIVLMANPSFFGEFLFIYLLLLFFNKYRFRNRFKSIDLAPVSKKPKRYPTLLTTLLLSFSLRYFESSIQSFSQVKNR